MRIFAKIKIVGDVYHYYKLTRLTDNELVWVWVGRMGNQYNFKFEVDCNRIIHHFNLKFKPEDLVLPEAVE